MRSRKSSSRTWKQSKTLGARCFPEGSPFGSYWIGGSKAVVCWPNSIAISGADLGPSLPGYAEHTEARKLPRKYGIDQGENQVFFLHREYFPPENHVSNYIFFRKWRTARVSHIPPINSNESLMARAANSFFQNMVGGSNFYFNRPEVAKRQKNGK